MVAMTPPMVVMTPQPGEVRGRGAATNLLPGGVQSTILEGYIRTGLDSNLALHQRNFDLQKAQLDLKRAVSMFYPQAGINSQYTLADGGRSQSIPVGDLLNEVYSTLNKLTATNKFPQVANQSIAFLPNNYQDSKVEVTLPVINPDLQHNKQVSGEMINTRRADVDIYKRELVQQIRQAYYQYLQAGKSVDIYTNALNLVKENRRVSEKFVENGMATRESVMRAQTQVSQVESSLIEAKNNYRNAAAYFNFLLNRPLDAQIQADPALTADPLAPTGAGAENSGASAGREESGVQGGESGVPTGREEPGVPTGREELARLQSMRKVLESNLKWDRNYLVPKLNAFYDVGFQGFGFHPDGSQFYQLAGLQLQWSLFKAGDNKYKIRQTQLDIESIGDQYRQLTQQLTLEVQTAANNYYSALEALRSLADEVSSARETYRLAEKRYNAGQALQIELIDTRTQLTSAEIRYSLGGLTALNRAAELERVTAAYKLK